MSEPTRKYLGRALALVLLLSTCACAPGGASEADHQPPTTDDVLVPVAQRTVVDQRVGDALLRVVVLRSGDRAEASMEVAPAGGQPTLIAEEIRIGDDHFVHLPGAAAVLGDDLWIRLDLSDERHVRFLEEHPVGLIDEADRPAEPEGTGIRVRREPVSMPPEIGPPPADRVVAFEDIHELPALTLPMPG
jgi:hypothetical protein